MVRQSAVGRVETETFHEPGNPTTSELWFDLLPSGVGYPLTDTRQVVSTIYIYIHGSGSITLLVWTRHVLTVAPRLVLSVSSEAQYVCRAPKAAV